MKLPSPSPSPPSGQTQAHFSGFSSPLTLRTGSRRRNHTQLPSQTMETVVEESGGENQKVYVAVGKSLKQASTLVQWAMRNFVDKEMVILHVHQPSPLIPTLLGKLPASLANAEVVTAFRNEEWQETRKRLNKYLTICTRSKANA